MKSDPRSHRRTCRGYEKGTSCTEVTSDTVLPVEAAVLAGGYTYEPPGIAQILSLSPTSGRVGLIVTITTTGFQDDFSTSAPRVYFGSTEATCVSATTTTISVISVCGH